MTNSVPAGIIFDPRVVSLTASRRILTTEGLKRNVSAQIAFRYGRESKIEPRFEDVSLIFEIEDPRAARNSFRKIV